MEGEQHEFNRSDVIVRPAPGTTGRRHYETRYPILITGTDEEETVLFGYHLASGRVVRAAYFPWDLTNAEKIGSIEVTDYIFESVDKRDKDASRLLDSIFDYVRDSHEHEKEE